jgi:hypothetical protein
MKFVVEQRRDGFIAYPLGLKGVVVGEGDTREDALSDAKSAVCFHRDTFGPDTMTEVYDTPSAEIVDITIDQ